MLAGLLFFCICVVVGVVLGNKVNDLIEGEYPSRQREGLAQLVAVTLFLVMVFGVPSAVAWYFEFPTLIGQTDVATFDAEGNLVYHKWGLYTPPGLEVVNAREGERWTILHSSNCPFILVEKDNYVLEVGLDVIATLKDPKVFYRLKERRQQGADVSTVLGEDIKKDVIRMIIQDLNEIRVSAGSCKWDFLGSPPKALSCHAGKIIEDNLQPKYAREGVEISTEVYAQSYWKF